MPAIITLDEIVTPSSVDDVLQLELSVAAQLGLPVTSWQPLDPSRTILQTNANLISQMSGNIAQIAQGGYASYAAIMLAGSSPYNDGAGYLTTWMDLRCGDQYNVQRTQPSAATGPIPVQNITGTAQTYQAGQLHFQHPTSGATYTNTAPGTIAAAASPPTPVTSTISVIADPAFVGPIGTLASGQTAILLTPFPGVTTLAQGTTGTGTGSIVGSTIETNAHYLSRCEAKLGTLSPNGSSQAFQFVAESLPVFGSSIQQPNDLTDYAASTNVAIATAANALLTALGFTSGAQLYSQPTSANPWGVNVPVTRADAFLNTGAGIVDVYVANASGGLLGCAQNPITNVTWTSGVATVTCSAPHELQDGWWVIISGVVGASAVNNTIAGTVAWQVTATPTTHEFSFALATTPGTYVSGGSVEGGDLGMVDAAIQAQVVPLGFPAIVLAAINTPILVTATIYIPTVQAITAASAVTNITNALTAYFASVPVGGVTADGSAGILPSSEILVQIANANSGTVSVKMTTPLINVDTSLGSGLVPTLDPGSSFTVLFV